MALLSSNRSRVALVFSIFFCLQTEGVAAKTESDDDKLHEGHPSAKSTTQSEVEDLSVEGYRAILSRGQVADGSVVMVRLEVPLESQITENKLSGEFGQIGFPFYQSSEKLKDKKVFEAVLGVPYLHDSGNFTVKIKALASEKESHELRLPLTVVPASYPSERLSVDPDRVKLSPKNLKRVRAEIRRIVPVYRKVTRERHWVGPFELPVKSKVTSVFGTKRIFNGEMKSFHKGVDLRADIGTPIRAPAGGIVRMSEDLFFTGNTVLLDHGYGVVTIYAHFHKLKVKKGQRVRRGQVLGLAGKTGRASGPHLHWGAVIHKVKVNPMELVQYIR